MNFAEILIIALGLSMDCLAVSVSFGLRKNVQWKDFTENLHSFLACFRDLSAGRLAGRKFSPESRFSDDHWIAFGILSFIGLKNDL